MQINVVDCKIHGDNSSETSANPTSLRIHEVTLGTLVEWDEFQR